MKIKELLKTVNVAWSPPSQHPILLAAGTAAQQLDASFNTSASLDLYLLNLQQPGYDMELKASVPSDQRFHKIIWGTSATNPAGIIVGGCDYGMVKLYSAAKILSRESDCLLSSPDRHTGPVRALDLNPFQSNLLATGATESEIYIWDIVNTTTPMTPGTRSQPAEDVQYIQWNKQVQHILASTFSQRCVIWDLRKNEPIIKLTDVNAKIRWKAVQWHPEIATQLCLASEDDQAPIIQLWDLRNSSSPLKTLHHHQRGVLSIAWCLQDPDLLLSCAKDNTILCWNPNTDAPEGAEVLCELAQTNQWNFDVAWCPRSPGLVVGSSFDGHATVYSLLGGQQQASGETSSQIVDSFPGMDPFRQPLPTVNSVPAVALKKAPRWLKKPVGATFGFGGKLVTFETERGDGDLTGAYRKVIVSQVVTNPEMIQRSNYLETALKSGQFVDYCQEKINNSTDEHTKQVWTYVGAYFSEDATRSFLELLGYNMNMINDKLKQYVPLDDVNEITDGMARLDSQNGNAFDGGAAFDAIAQQEQKKAVIPAPPHDLVINTSDDKEGLITQAILTGNIEAAVALCFENKRYADAVILSMAGGPELLAKTQYKYFAEHTGTLNCLINCLVSENWSDIVKNCDIKCWKDILVGIFNHTSAEECSALCDALGDRLACSDDPALRKNAQLCYICSGNLNRVIGVAETDIQETVELVMILKRALEHSGLRSVSIDGNIAEVLSQYAEMLASEGDFEAAMNYVGDGQDARIALLRDRLYRATTESLPAQPIAKNQPAQPMAKNYYEPAIKPQNSYAAPPAQMQWNTSPLQNSYTMGQMQSQVSPPVQTMQPTPVKPYGQPAPVQAPPLAPAQATLGGSRPSSVGPHSRSKYLIDPAVNSGLPSTGYSQQHMYNSPSMPGMPAQKNYPGNYSNYMQSSVPDPVPDPYKPMNMMTPAAIPAQTFPGGVHDPLRPQGLTQNDQVYQPPPQQMGWNDPPIAKSSRIQPVNEYQAVNPILHPLQGTAPMQEYNPPEEHYHQNTRMVPDQQYSNNPYYSENQYKAPYEPMRPMQPVQPVQPVQVAKIAEPEKPKLPIPEQHLHLKTVLDELRIQCYESAKNPQMKKKIEDVTKKLEVLYDCLRENSLSQHTLQGLHQISQMIQSGNYTNGLTVHTQLVSGPDFSQIASFLPGIKVLLQSALQLGVYIT